MAAEKYMKAVQYEHYGGGADALKHVEVPIPSPKKGEVLLKVEAASINPIDWKYQNGIARPFLPSKFPFIPVSDVAGEVVEVGPDVSNVKRGDKVVTLLNIGGGLAEFAVAPAAITVIRPPELPPAESSSLVIAGVTAVVALRSTGIKLDGTTQPVNVLITAASGGVGHYAVQLAKYAGAHVTATCGARNIEFVKSLGADEVLDYKTLEGASLKSPSGRKYDSVIHCASGIPWATFEPNLSTEGKVVDITPGVKSILTSGLQKITFSKKRLYTYIVSPKREELQFVVDLAKEGKLKTVVDSRHPLSKAEEAWAKSMDGHATGKIVVEI